MRVHKSISLKQQYLDFFFHKNHKPAAHSSLVPDGDSTTLFTGSGMQSMLPFLLGKPHPLGTRLVNVQPCFRSQDIEEVGDRRHTTFFEMLGNWSFGDYFKEQQLTWIFEFLTSVVGLEPDRLYVTVHSGNQLFTADTEAIEIWQSLFRSVGIEARYSEQIGVSGGGERIFGYGDSKNWWSRCGEPGEMPAGEPGGSDSEIFYDFGADYRFHEQSQFSAEPCHVNCDCGRFVEIGNNVFMQYRKNVLGGFDALANKNIDFGGGFERILAAKENSPDVFATSAFLPIIRRIEELSLKRYANASAAEATAFGVIADHIRASVMLIGDKVFPSNREQGYVLRRLIRRAVRHGVRLRWESQSLETVVDASIQSLSDFYPHLEQQRQEILTTIVEEEGLFRKTLNRGLKTFSDSLAKGLIDGRRLFFLYESYGFPLEMSIEELRARGVSVDESGLKADFEEETERHRALSQSEGMQKFAGGLADHSKENIYHHTAAHLLLRALQVVVSPDIHQAGSNITKERVRYDFNLDRPLGPGEIERVESLVNRMICRGLVISSNEMEKEEARVSGVEGVFWDRYPPEVLVYEMTDAETGAIFSREICGGPHAGNTKELAALGSFKITKQENVGNKRRRVRAEFVGK